MEQATGNPQAAARARQQCFESYLAYRRAGGESKTTVAQLCALAASDIKRGDTTRIEQTLAQLLRTGIPPSALLTLSKLQAVLGGDRDPALAADPELPFDEAVELQLLLEALAAE